MSDGILRKPKRNNDLPIEEAIRVYVLKNIYGFNRKEFATGLLHLFEMECTNLTFNAYNG